MRMFCSITVMLQYFVCTFADLSACSITNKRLQQLNIWLWEWLLVDVVMPSTKLAVTAVGQGTLPGFAQGNAPLQDSLANPPRLMHMLSVRMSYLLFSSLN